MFPLIPAIPVIKGILEGIAIAKTVDEALSDDDA